jgi:hypothetical protein
MMMSRYVENKVRYDKLGAPSRLHLYSIVLHYFIISDMTTATVQTTLETPRPEISTPNPQLLRDPE